MNPTFTDSVCKQTKLLLLLFFLIIVKFDGFTQIVNIESKRMQSDSIRFALRSDFSLGYFDYVGNTKLRMKGGLTSQFKTKDMKKVFFFAGDYNFLKSGDNILIKAWIVHFRFNYKISELFRTEAFIQNQHNNLLDVNDRNIIGAGIRFKFFSKENIQLYLANSYIYEIETCDSLNSNFYNHRNSTYLSMTASVFKNKLGIINTIYFQPKYSDFSNYSLLEQLKFDLKISNKLSLFSLYNFYYNKLTPVGRKQHLNSIHFGLGLSL